MRLLCLTWLLIQLVIVYSINLEKYRLIRQQCERVPSNSECLKIKSKFFELIRKCQRIKTQQQALLCHQVKLKLCTIFPSTCRQSATTKYSQVYPTTRRTTTKRARIKTYSPRPRSSTTKPKLPTKDQMTDEEFVKVPVDSNQLRTRGEYCVRHRREKKCQKLLNNLKNMYSSCARKKPTKSEDLDCHSFQAHLCKAFPKFPPCLKARSK